MISGIIVAYFGKQQVDSLARFYSFFEMKMSGFPDVCEQFFAGLALNEEARADAASAPRFSVAVYFDF